MVKLFFYIFLLWTIIFPGHALAQENQNSFLNAFVRQNTGKEWKPMQQNTTESDLKGLQALSYLQGYNPAPLLKNVVKYDKNKSFPGYNLFLSGDVPGATLMDMKGIAVYQWHYPTASLPVDQRYCTKNWDRVRIFKNGDLLAMITFGGLLKIDKKSHLLWFRKLICHHDFDIGSGGDIYALTVADSRSGDSKGIKINSIAILSPDGVIKKTISLYDLFKKYHDPAYLHKINGSARYAQNNGNRTSGFVSGDAFHANSIQVLDGKWEGKNPAFKKGDLLISVRNLGVLICVDPDKEEIVWLMDTAFWSKGQHFAKQLDNGDILVFDNLYRPGLSRVVEFDPFAPKMVWEYSGQNGAFYSSYLGEAYRLPNGNTLITESENGHSMEVTPEKKIVWEFYNPHQIGKDNSQFYIIKKIQHFPDSYDRLIAITSQMQRVPMDPNLGWLQPAADKYPARGSS